MQVTPSLRNNVRLAKAKRNYLDTALCQRTTASYNTGVNAFSIFCVLHDVDFIKADWVGSEDTMVYFVCYLADTKMLAHSTIKSYLAGVRNYCIKNSLEYPFVRYNGQPMLQLKLVLRGIKKSRTPKALLRLPVTADIMLRFFELLNSNVFIGEYERLLMKAALSIAYFGFLRCGEFTTHTNKFDPEVNLCLGDVVIDNSNPQEAYITLKASKTDPFRCGVTVSYFKVNSPIDPVQNIHKFMRERSRYATDQMMPLFLFQDFTHLTRDRFLKRLHDLCNLSGIQGKNYSGHSFRIGAASSCAKQGIADHLIQSLGRWRSDCYKTYVRVSKSAIKNAQQKMAIGNDEI